MQAEGRQTYRDVVIAGLIALAAATALFLDTRIDSRAFDSGRAARAVVGRIGSDSPVPADSTLVMGHPLEEKR